MLTDPVGNETTWTYDNLDRVTTETNELSDTRTFKYDAASNLTEKVDRLGRKTVWEYDNRYRNTAEKWYDGSTLVRTLSFTYNAASQLTAASDPAATYGFTLDNLGRVTTESQDLSGLTPQLQYVSTYDAASRRTQLQAKIGGTNDFKNTFTYDNLHRLTKLEQQDVGGGNVVADKRFDFAYNASSAVTKIDRYADLTTSEHVASTHFTYDGLGRLKKMVHTEGTTAPSSGWGTDPLAGYEYAYDVGSRITSIDSYIDGLTEYDYDATSQLIGADHTGISDETYTYDENGNRTMSGYSTTDNNQLTTDGVYNYTYDDEGNRSRRTKISDSSYEEHTWDHRNRLTKIAFKNSGGTVTKSVDYIYDAFNRLIRRTLDPDGATGSAALVDAVFSWHADQINLQFDGSAAADLVNRYLWNPQAVDQIMAVEDVTSLGSAGTVKWAFTDHLGTPRDLASYNAGTDTTTLENHRVFDSYGKLVSQTNGSFTIAIGFTGVYFDITTSYNYHRARWYDMNAGRWVSEDPIGFAGRAANLQEYVGNSPTNFTDPSGLVKVNWKALFGKLTVQIDEGAGKYILQNGQEIAIRNWQHRGKNVTIEMLKKGGSQAKNLDDLAKRFPGLSIPIDKCGQPDFSKFKKFTAKGIDPAASNYADLAWNQVKAELKRTGNPELKKLLDNRDGIRWHHNANGDIEAIDAGIHEAFGHSGLHAIATSLKKSGHWDKIWAGVVGLGVAVIPGASYAGDDLNGRALDTAVDITPLRWSKMLWESLGAFLESCERSVFGDEWTDGMNEYRKDYWKKKKSEI
jgi:RHS repeat-associated protein